MVDRLDINLLNLLLVLPNDIQQSIVFVAPIPVFLADREIGSAVYERDTHRSFFRITFHEPGDYRELAYRYPACETEPIAKPSSETRFAITKIIYASKGPV